MGGSRKRERSGNSKPADKSAVISSSESNKESSVEKVASSNGSMMVSLDDIEHHPDYIKRKKVLLAAKEKKAKQADHNRKLQIDNVNELYAFELEDLEAKCQAECDQLKQNIHERLTEKHRLEQQASTSNTRMNTRQATNVESTGDLSQHSANNSSNNGTNVSSTSLGGVSRSGIPKKNNGTVFGGSIDKILSEECVREDFVSIVRDLEDRAVTYTRHQKARLPALDVEIIDNSLAIESRPRRGSIDQTIGLNSSKPNTTPKREVYRVGCMVSVHTTDSDEQLNGKIVVVGEDDVVIRLHTGPRLRIPLAQLRDRRVTILRDAETYRDMALMLGDR